MEAIVTCHGPCTLRITFKDGQVARLQSVEWFKRLEDGGVIVKTYGNEPATNRKVLKVEVFSE
jgi:hypothetical protein